MSLRVERTAAAVVLTVDRPAVRNAIDPDVVARLEDAVRELESDASVRAVVLTGAGEAFISGADLRYLRDAPAEEARATLGRMAALLDRLAALPVPVIAAVPGPCIGGGAEVLVATDMRIAEEHATFSFRHAMMGLAPAWGGTTRLAHLVSRGAASRLLLTACTIDAGEALRIGLVDQVVPRGASRERALAIAAVVASVSQSSVATLKRTIAGAYTLPAADSFALERAELDALWAKSKR